MSTYTSSHYNVLVPVPEEQEFLLYNTLTGALEVLQQYHGEALRDMIQHNGHGTKALDGEVQSYLFEKGYLTEFPSGDAEISAFHNSYLKQRDFLLGNVEVAGMGLTIATTMNCNMGCPYCFEFEKPNKTLKSQDDIRHIINYIKDMMAKAPVKRWESFSLTWYGGEPLINKHAISELSPHLIRLCKENNIKFRSTIITNGLLLTEEAWALLKESQVTTAQVTLDGPAITHDKYRPLKGGTQKGNYYRILENLSHVPDGIKLVIRINVDREISNHFDTFFKDLRDYNIWPQKFGSIVFDPAWLRSYHFTEDSTSKHLNVNEYFEVKENFRKLQVKLFNDYAEEQGLKKARLKFNMPEKQKECGTWVSPYNIVIDPEGFVQKCWETIHLTKHHIHHVSEGFDASRFKEYLDYDRFDVNQMCYSCKYLPVCDQLSCSHQALEHKDNPPCTYWKEKTPSALKDQYLLFKSNPDQIVFPGHQDKINMGHANK
jgi:uncharacterized protein